MRERSTRLRGFATTFELQTPQENRVRDAREALSELPSPATRAPRAAFAPGSSLD